MDKIHKNIQISKLNDLTSATATECSLAYQVFNQSQLPQHESYDYVFVTKALGLATRNRHKNNLFLPRGSCENLTLDLIKMTPHDEV
jgi:hypothetical protein